MERSWDNFCIENWKTLWWERMWALSLCCVSNWFSQARHMLLTLLCWTRLTNVDGIGVYWVSFMKFRTWRASTFFSEDSNLVTILLLFVTGGKTCFTWTLSLRNEITSLSLLSGDFLTKNPLQIPKSVNLFSASWTESTPWCHDISWPSHQQAPNFVSVAEGSPTPTCITPSTCTCIWRWACVVSVSEDMLPPWKEICIHQSLIKITWKEQTLSKGAKPVFNSLSSDLWLW